MAATPTWKVFDSHKKYQASCHEVEAAAALVSFYGPGSTIRDGHSVRQVVWTEGAQYDGEAHESYDQVVALVHQRLFLRKAAP